MSDVDDYLRSAHDSGRSTALMRILGIEDSTVESVSDDDVYGRELKAGLLPGERLELAARVDSLLEALPPDPNSRLDEMTRIRLEAYAMGLRGDTEPS